MVIAAAFSSWPSFQKILIFPLPPLSGYGAAYTLKEFLTAKSDDVEGRTQMYERIVKGDNFLATGLPESFHVLVKELQGLCLNMELIEE